MKVNFYLPTMVVLGLSLLYSSCNNDDFEDDVVSSNKATQKNVILDAPVQENANELYENLMSAFNQQSTRSSESLVYPDYYGGAFINDDGILVVYTKDNISSKLQSDITRAVGTNHYIVKSCNYSYNQLNHVMDIIDDKVFNENSIVKFPNVLYAAIDDENNCIVVGLKETSAAAIEDFKSMISNSECIKFTKTKDGEFTAKKNIYAGSMAFVNSSATNISYSIAYRAKKGNTYGIITAGHAVALNEKLYKFGVPVATCTARKFGGEVDAAFCEVTDMVSYSLSNAFEGDTLTLLSPDISEPGTGTTINVRGLGQHTSGKVVNTRASCSFSENNGQNKVSFTNLTKISTNTVLVPGWSGGVVYSFVSSQSKRYTLGVILGRLQEGNVVYGFYSKANKINSALGVSRY